MQLCAELWPRWTTALTSVHELPVLMKDIMTSCWGYDGPNRYFLLQLIRVHVKNLFRYECWSFLKEHYWILTVYIMKAGPEMLLIAVAHVSYGYLWMSGVCRHDCGKSGTEHRCLILANSCFCQIISSCLLHPPSYFCPPPNIWHVYAPAEWLHSFMQLLSSRTEQEQGPGHPVKFTMYGWDTPQSTPTCTPPSSARKTN